MDAQDGVTEFKRMNPLIDNVVFAPSHELWVITAVDDVPLVDGKRSDLTVTVSRNGWPVKQFTYPAYRIWTLLAHWTEGLAELETTPIVAAPVSLGPHANLFRVHAPLQDGSCRFCYTAWPCEEIRTKVGVS